MLRLTKKKEKKLHENINYLIQQQNIDIETLSAQTGIPEPTLNKIRRNDSNPTVATLEPLADFFRYDIDTLLYEDISNTLFQKKSSAGKFRHIPIIDIKEANKWPIKTKLIKFIGAAGINHDEVFSIEVSGQSMSPVFREGSIVVVDIKIKPKEGDYVLCILEDNEPVFRQLFMDGKKHFFRPINPNFGDLTLYEEFKIIGVIIKSIFSFV